MLSFDCRKEKKIPFEFEEQIVKFQPVRLNPFLFVNRKKNQTLPVQSSSIIPEVAPSCRHREVSVG